MKQIALLCLAACLFTITLPAQSQTDSTYLDLGRVQLRRDFAQTIQLKGEELEKLPFTNLSEVVNVWFSGSLNNKGNLTYVVDGNIVQDVNAFHIQDIAEITLVDNALSRLNGATGDQQLVVISTKRGAEKSGFSVGAQFNRLDQRFSQAEHTSVSEPALFHQYTLSGHHNTAGYHFGGSAGFLRDVNPFPGTIQTSDLHDLNRFRLRGYLQKQLNEHHSIGLHANYLSQTSDNEHLYRIPLYSRSSTANEMEETGYSERAAKNSQATGLFNAELTLNSRFSNKVSNQLGLHYNRIQYSNGSSFEDRVFGAQPSSYMQNDTLRTHLRSVYLRNTFTYSQPLGS